MISGARPQFIKLSPLIRACEKNKIEVYHIHSGQHYDTNMSDKIFEDLNIPPPYVNLNVGSGSHGMQTAKMLELMEKEIIKIRPDLVLVVGDTNSTLAGALTAVKLNIPVVHLEAGLRSFDWKMPEEINRMVVDRLSSLCITSTETAVKNLREEGIQKEKIFVTGDIMVDTLYYGLERINKDVSKPTFILVTIHRQETVDSEVNCRKILDIFRKSPALLVFAIHPRTRKRFEEFNMLEDLLLLEKEGKLQLLPPQGYLDFLELHYAASGVLTDSGGLQKEAFIMKKPCITLRTTSEWVESIESGANRLLGLKLEPVIQSLNEMLSGEFNVDVDHPYGDGQAADTIIRTLQEKLANDQIKLEDNIYRG